MRHRILFVPMVLILACGHSAAPSGTTVDTYQQPRLTAVGAYGTQFEFDADGFPTHIAGEDATFELTWSDGGLVSASASSSTLQLQASFEYSDGRVTGMTVAGPLQPYRDGGMGPEMTSTSLEYDATGALSRWVSGSSETTYHYDSAGALIRIDHGQLGAAPSSSDTFEYGPSGCPVLVTEGNTTFTYSYSAGRLSAASDTGEQQYPVDYGDAGWILEFEGTGTGLRPLSYAPGVSRGLSVSPGIWSGDFAYGFPAHSELFRLDGHCDVSMRSQEVVLALLLESLPGAQQ